MTTNRPLRVFLCHSSADKPAVRELYQKLRAEPWIQPWLDEEELYPGQDWNMEIEKAVEAADAIIVCLTKNSINKEGYVQRELRIVLDFADYKPEGTIYILPVRLEECQPPRRLRTWQCADYFEGKREHAFERLLVSLKKRAESLSLKNEKSLQDEADEHVRKAIAPKIERGAAEQSISEKQELQANERKKSEKEEFEAKEKIILQTKPAPATRNVALSLFGIGGIILFFLICGGYILNYLINNLPTTKSTVSPTKAMITTLPVFTNIPFTYTPNPTPILAMDPNQLFEKRNECFYMQQSKDWNNSINCYKNILEFSTTPEDKAEAYFRIGTNYNFLGDYNSAIKYLLDGLQLDQSNTINKTDILVWLSLSYQSNGQIVEACKYFAQALDIAQQIDYLWAIQHAQDGLKNCP
jgi:hypothetical protein